MRPLYSHEAEQSVLGALLLKNDAFDLIPHVEPEHFWSEAHRQIFTELRRMLAAGKRVDVVTLAAALEQAGLLESIGMEYLGDLLTAVPSSAGIANYAKIVVDRATERALADVAVQVGELATERGDLDERMQKASKLLFDLTDRVVEKDGAPVGDGLIDFANALEQRMESKGGITGVPTGLVDLDRVLCGLQRGDLVIVAGRPSMGKTSLAGQWAVERGLDGHVTMIFSMEMPRAQLIERAVSVTGRIDSQKLRTGELTPDDWDRISAAMGRLKGANFIIDDTPQLSPHQMLARARRIKRKYGRLDLIVVDYLQLMDARGDTRNEALASVTRALKLTARELDVPVVLLSQLSRKCEERTDKRPLMSDLRESGAIEQDADVIVFVYRDEVYNPSTAYVNTAELIVAKQRNGPPGKVMTSWLGEFYSFGNLDWKDMPKPVSKPERKREKVFE